MDDDALMLAAAAGDTEAFGCLVRAYQRRLVCFAGRMLGSVHDISTAEDVAQEAFLRLWHGRAAYRAEGHLDRLLLRIVANLCRDRGRSYRSEVSLDEAGEAAAPLAGSPPARLESRSLAEAVRLAVHALPESQRAVFVLSHYEGLGYREIAEILGCPPGTVASRKHLAVQALRRRLRSWSPEETTL